MENPEEDAGSLADASRLASARERNIGQREDNAMSECSVDGASSPMPDLTTETLLHMIDELVDEPRGQEVSGAAAAPRTAAALVAETNITSSISTVTSRKEDKCDSNNETTHQTISQQPKQVPKLTIKLPANSTHKFNEVYTKSSSSDLSESDSSENDESTSTSDQAPTSGKIITESVPKVTIKFGKPGTECEGKFYAQQIVPKLTIKTHDLESEEESVTKIKLKVSQQEEKSPDKIPKLTIKPITKPDNQQLSPRLLIKPIPKLENQQLSPKLTIKSIPKPEKQLSPKLTIKPIKPPENYKESHSDKYETPQIPKLKISQDYISLRESNDSAQVPKITIKPVFKAECETNQKTSKKVTSKCDNNEHIPVVTKIHIKPIQKPVESDSSSDYSNHSSQDKIPIISKLNIKPIIKPKDDKLNHTETEIPNITKLNIKPIINPNDSCTEQRNCDTWSSFDKDIPVITKLNIKPVVEPSSEETSKDSENPSSETGNSSDDTNDSIPIVTKLNIKPIVRPSCMVPLNIRPVRLDESSVPVVTKLNIKPVLKPDDKVPHVSPKKSGHRSPAYPDYIPLVTKLNIKPVLSPNECESKKDDQLVEIPKNPPLLMTIRTKPDTSCSSEIELNKLLNTPEYELCNKFNEISTSLDINSLKPSNNEIQTDLVTKLKCDEEIYLNKSKEVLEIVEKDCSAPALNENYVNSILAELPAHTGPSCTQSNDNADNSHETAEESETLDQDSFNAKSQNCVSINDVIETINAHKASGNGISDSKLDEPSTIVVENCERQDSCTDNRNDEHTLEATFTENSDINETTTIDVKNYTAIQSPISSNYSNKKKPQKRQRRVAKLKGSPPKRLRSTRIALKIQQAESAKDIEEEEPAPENSLQETTRSTLSELLFNKPLPLIPKSDVENSQENVKSLNQNSSGFGGTSRTDLHNFLSNIQDKPLETPARSQKDESWSGNNVNELQSNDASTASSDVLNLAQMMNTNSQDDGISLNDSFACDCSENVSNFDPLCINISKNSLEGLTGSKTSLEGISECINESKMSLEINAISKEEVLETPQRKKRGRPRKKPLPDNEPVLLTPVMPTPVIEERPQRSARLSRGTPTVRRAPRRRGRGRGGPNRSSTDFGQLSPHLDISIETNEKSPEGKVGTHLDIDPTSSTIKLPRMTEVLNKMPSVFSSPLSRRKSGMDSECSPASSEMQDSPADTPTRPLRGKGSRGGRVYVPRGNRRARGGGRGATYMKETMGIYGRVCGPATSTIELHAEETCMMDDNASQARPSLLMDEDSQSSVKSLTNDSSKGKKARIEFDSSKIWTAAHVKEYQWADGKLFMIQEQVASFLGVRSFNQQYPQLKRRTIVGEELAYLQDKGIVSLGTTAGDITAVDASEVLDIMLSDYPHKYEEFRSHQRQRQRMGLEAATPEVRRDRIEMKAELKVAELKAEPPKIDPEKLRLEMAAQARAAAAEYNARLNMQRFKSCSDLQSMQIHRRRPMPPTAPLASVVPPCGLYPLALLPGQYQHTYVRYTPEQLRYFPVNTALDAPPAPPRQVTTDTESEEEWSTQNHSESDSEQEQCSSAKRVKLSSSSKRLSVVRTSVKDESSESKSRDGSHSGWRDAADNCQVCGLKEEANRKYSHERFLHCSQCLAKLHPSCLELGPDTIRKCRDYAWQCAECKTCYGCHLPADDDKMLFCDLCDRGYHIYCVGLKDVPSGRWHCVECAVCKSCGARDPAGQPGADAGGNSNPQWHYHSKRGAGGHKVYSHSLCTPCARKSKTGHRSNANSKAFPVEEKSCDADKNAHRIGRYCPLCNRSFIGPKGTMQLAICKLCDRQLHQECVKQTVSNLNVLDYTCADCRRGGITSRAAAARLAPRTIATLFMAKRRFNKYAHRQYMRKRQKDKPSELTVTPSRHDQLYPLEEEPDTSIDLDADTTIDLDADTTIDLDTDTPIDLDPDTPTPTIDLDPDTPIDLDTPTDLDVPNDADADPSELDSLSELEVDRTSMETDEPMLIDEEHDMQDIDETANAVKALQMDYD